MSDEAALLAAVHAYPLDDAPRLVYADWLQEHGRPERAEFIRVQCELQDLPASDARFAALEAREQELRDAWAEEWLKPLHKDARGALFSRGFPEPSLARLSAQGLYRVAEKRLQSAPLWRYRHTTTGNELDRLLAWPHLHKLTTFSLREPDLPAGWVEAIAACEGLRNVTELAFTDCTMGADDLKTVLDAWVGRRLFSLWVNECPVGDAGARVIAEHPATRGLRFLRAHTAGLTARGIQVLVDSPHLDRVTLATFAHNPIRDTGARHVRRWAALAGMKELYLMNARLTKRGRALFTDVPGVMVRLD